MMILIIILLIRIKNESIYIYDILKMTNEILNIIVFKYIYI